MRLSVFPLLSTIIPSCLGLNMDESPTRADAVAVEKIKVMVMMFFQAANFICQPPEESSTMTYVDKSLRHELESMIHVDASPFPISS
ncbi:hypothetical protein EV426DRAFT_592213 [Tirmania nivea]|nr:hypothetical protein EV426DRAFT_592213 [Tirmania nivea]